ncbi:arginine metabolism regulation protein II [Neophaeococcomyces mojaviensis]|uniref:Arginine metabolism regulation protein II n=1 Tax=Neophaeococcomyces mojaviensis TaxID=3383035 RepID=A0ACC2ZX38_9EURO|nr:arginine metabolism regulation protein II [Knufia sp. JES_112]
MRRIFGNVGADLRARLSSSEIDAMLQRIDGCPAGSSMREKGGFSVFAIQTAISSPEEIQPPTLAADKLGPVMSSIEAGQIHGRRQPYRLSPLSRTQSSLVEQPTPGSLGTFAEPDNPNHQEQQPYGPGDSKLETSAYYHGESTGFSPSADVDGVLEIENTDYPYTATRPDNSYFARFPQGYRRRVAPQTPSSHLELLQIPSALKRLIHHWVNFTSGKLVLVDEPHNPCRTMMLPMALKGLMSSSETSTAEIATFHAICACAAYNLFELGGRKCEQDQAIALKHDQQAIHHLRYNLTQADQHCDQSFAMAIMACITIEAISGHTSRWQAHVSGGLAYLGKLQSRGVDLNILSAFQAHMVSMAILCGCDVPTELKSFLQGTETLELTFPYYGASSSFLRNQDRMNALASSETPTNARDLDLLELQLYLDFPAGTQGALPKSHATMVHHMAQAFYYATLVFFQRSVRRSDLDAVQVLVENGVKQLESIESVGQGSAGSVMMWAALVLGAECGTADLQARMRTWFGVKQKLGFRNVSVLGNLVSTLWSYRARGDMDTTWRDLTRLNRFDVFRL